MISDKGVSGFGRFLIFSDKKRRGVGKFLILADKGGGGVSKPPFLADIICEQSLTVWELRCFEDFEEKDDRVSQLINE